MELLGLDQKMLCYGHYHCYQHLVLHEVVASKGHLRIGDKVLGQTELFKGIFPSQWQNLGYISLSKNSIAVDTEPQPEHWHHHWDRAPRSHVWFSELAWTMIFNCSSGDQDERHSALLANSDHTWSEQHHVLTYLTLSQTAEFRYCCIFLI